MDSNFQVRISADISALQASLKNVEQTLGKFTQSSDSATGSMAKMNNEAGRGRLVAFAFGQVIRDAGFFANDFGLGLLAISNNIPILIDQLVMMSNVSKGLGVAISLAGSVITAALTVVAYTMMYTKKATEQFNNELAKNTGEAEKNALMLKSLVSIAKDETLSLRQRQDAVNQINSEYKEFNNTLTVAGASSQKTTELVDRLSKSMLLNAQATAIANEYSRISSELFKAQNTPLAQQADLLDKATVYWRSFLDFLNPFTGNKNPIKDFTDGARAGLNKFGLENFTAKTKEFKSSMATLETQLKGVLTQISALGLNKPPKSPLAPLEKSTLVVDERMKSVIEALNAYQSRISDIEKTPGITPFDVKKQSVEALGDLIVNLQKIDGTQDTVAKLTTKFNELNLAITKFPFSLPLFEMVPQMIKQFTDESIREMERLEQQVQDTFEFGIEDVISNSVMAIGQALASGGNIGKGFGAALLDSIATMAEQLGRMAIGIGIAIDGIKKALQSLNPLVAIGAGIALLAIAGAARAGARNIAGGGSANGGMVASTPTGSSFGGMRGTTPFPNSNPMNNGQIGNVIAETKISGNDLSILIKRADNNRNEYF
jgi:hypothetical protein